MSWKSLLSAGIALCALLSSTAFAAPTITATPLAYVAAEGKIKWEIRITQNDAAYTGSLSTELPITLTSVTPAFVTQLFDAGGDDTNNASATTTYYYNETAAASGTLLWNITDPADAANHTQNVGANPFAAVPGTATEGLFIDTAAKKLFAALGSSVSLPDVDGVTAGKQVAVLHVTTLDGRLAWTNAIVGENGVQYSGITGSKTSIIRGDMNANLARNFQDVSPFGLALNNAAQYAINFPGLDRIARGDMNGNGAFNFQDVAPFGNCLSNPVSCPANPTGSGSGGEGLVGGSSVVPEPATIAMAVIGFIASLGVYRRKH